MISNFYSSLPFTLLVWCIFWPIHLMVDGYGQLTLRLISFETTNRCDAFGGKCDPFFSISAVTCGENCTLGQAMETKIYENQALINFDSDLGNGIINPLVYSFSLWNGSFNVTIHIWDNDDGGPNDFLAEFNIFALFRPTWGAETSVVMQRKICTDNSDSCLTLNYTASCLSHYYGEECQVNCYPRDNITCHYNCDSSNGSKICLDGWTGENCLDWISPSTVSLPYANSSTAHPKLSTTVEGSTSLLSVEWNSDTRQLPTMTVTSQAIRSQITSLTAQSPIETTQILSYIKKSSMATKPSTSKPTENTEASKTYFSHITGLTIVVVIDTIVILLLTTAVVILYRKFNATPRLTTNRYNTGFSDIPETEIVPSTRGPQLQMAIEDNPQRREFLELNVVRETPTYGNISSPSPMNGQPLYQPLVKTSESAYMRLQRQEKMDVAKEITIL